MVPTSAIPLQISDYYILPLSLPPLPSFPSPATHYLYLRPHDPKIPTPSTPRSLFLVNIPIDATEIHLKHLFSTQLELPSGRIEDVVFDGPKKTAVAEDVEASKAVRVVGKKNKKRKREDELESFKGLDDAKLPDVWDRELHRSGSSAVVVFVDRTSMEAAVKAVRKARKHDVEIPWGEGVEAKVPALGSERYLAHHTLRYPPQAELISSIDAYMTAFAAREASRARALAQKRQEPDEDGFITVTRGGRTGPARQEEAQEKLEKQKEKQKGLDDFYRFQSREKRKERSRELLKKFEEDREKVRKMRERRGRFKPD